MEYLAFYRRLTAALPPGTVLQNPGGGTTTTLSYTKSDNLAYQRGRTRIYVSISDLYAAYQRFLGREVSSADLRHFAPRVFDSKRSGHSCNCTVFFMALRAMQLVDRVEGGGRVGDPYWVDLGGSQGPSG